MILAKTICKFSKKQELFDKKEKMHQLKDKSFFINPFSSNEIEYRKWRYNYDFPLFFACDKDLTCDKVIKIIKEKAKKGLFKVILECKIIDDIREYLISKGYLIFDIEYRNTSGLSVVYPTVVWEHHDPCIKDYKFYLM